MGLVKIAAQATLCLVLVCVACISYGIGAERSLINSDSSAAWSITNFFTADDVRAELQAALLHGSVHESRRLAKDLALLKPASEYPYEAALTVAFTEDDAQAMEKFAAASIARQPRSLAARLYLLKASEERRDYAAVIEHYERLMELRSLNAIILSDALIGVFRQADEWPLLIEYLEGTPSNGQILVNRLLREPDLQPGLAKLMIKYPSGQSTLLLRAIQERGYEYAYSIWKSYIIPFAEYDVAQYPFNGSFKRFSAPSPFNWFVSTERAEFQPQGGLFISLSGTGTPLVARQVFAAPAGSYLLRTEARGRMRERGGALEWRVDCSETAQRLASTVIQLQQATEIEVFETKLEVPGTACAFQTIELRGRAGEFPMTARIEVLSVSLIADID